MNTAKEYVRESINRFGIEETVKAFCACAYEDGIRLGRAQGFEAGERAEQTFPRSKDMTGS